MEKTFKKYNNVTNAWESVPSPNISVSQYLESGTNISDTNVVVTNPNYAEESSGKTTLSDTLGNISDDISRLQRNVSWLAEHGGGGGGGTGGTYNPYGIEVSEPLVANGGNVYLSEDEIKNVSITFRITGGYDGDIITYTFSYDGNPRSGEIEIDKYLTFTFDNSKSSANTHDVKIEATNPFNRTITPFRFSISKLALSVKFAGVLDNKIYYLMQDAPGVLPFDVVNGVLNSNTTIRAYSNEGGQDSVAYINDTELAKRVELDFKKIVPNPSPGEDYIISYGGQMVLPGGTTVSTEGEPFRVRVINPSQLTITIGVNGEGGSEEIIAPQNSNLNCSFRVYGPSVIPWVYYCAKIENLTKNTAFLTKGVYYSDDLHVEGKTVYDNNIAYMGTSNSFQYNLSENNFDVDNIVRIYVKAWSNDGVSFVAETYKEFTIGEENNDIWGRQYNARINGEPDTLLASFNRFNTSPTSQFLWTSEIDEYRPINGNILYGLKTYMNVLNANDTSGIITSTDTPHLRLQNRAYATVDFSEYYSEIQNMFAQNQTFTISITLKADNQAGNKHTFFLWGENNSDGTLRNGIRIDNGAVKWECAVDAGGGRIDIKHLSCPIPSNERVTIDFTYDKGSLKLYKNGIINNVVNADKLSYSNYLPSTAFFGANNVNGTIGNYSDLDIFEFSVYTRALNDMQTIINGKNARLLNMEPESIIEYDDWLHKNFISIPSSSETPSSTFFNNGDFVPFFSIQQVENIQSTSRIPTLILTFPAGSDFTREYFYGPATDTGGTTPCTASYYDPNLKDQSVGFNALVSLQGTSTLLYRVKNLEMRMADRVTIEGVEVPVLFQPKDTWLPESQFTLKADIVDSAHANNAVIGEWINTEGKSSGILVDNPAMQIFEGENRPKDVDLNGTPIIDPETNVDYDTRVTIKHTLEGFPILLFIKFTNDDAFTFVGIYSFNLGRYSYYNMGIKFLDCFSRRDVEQRKVPCPAVITYYKEKTQYGNINPQTDIFSFEFDNEANLVEPKWTAMWTQFDISIINDLGSFRYPEGNVDEAAWNGLVNLFSQTAHFNTTAPPGGTLPKYIAEDGIEYSLFQGMKKYHIEGEGETKKYVTDGENIDQSTINIQELTESINVNNAVAYFIIANAFGMTDSLGKNLTLRTWNRGATWWCCFYDMDTALGLSNNGAENVLVTALIDKITTIVDTDRRLTTMRIDYHDSESQYAQHLSKLWAIFRSQSYLTATSTLSTPPYEDAWCKLRQANGPLSTSEKFVDMMQERVEVCGELIFDYDYNSKYIITTEGTTASSQFLHGTRVDFVKDWLKRHLYFLDGVFDVTLYTEISGGKTFGDSPYYNQGVNMTVYFRNTDRPRLTLQASTPSFLKISVGTGAESKFYIDTENQDTNVYLANNTSTSSQMVIRGSSTLLKIDGLQGAFKKLSDENQKGVLKSLESFDVSLSQGIDDNPIGRIEAFLDDTSSIVESVNLSGTKLLSNNYYLADFTNFQKLINIDIRNSDVGSLLLPYPPTVLESLSIENSKLQSLSLSNQPKLSGISFENCSRLGSVNLIGCDSITGLSFYSLGLLREVAVQNCNSIETLEINNCNALSQLTVNNNSTLKSLIIRNCRELLTINVFGNSLLETLIIDNCTNLNLNINVEGGALKSIELTNVWTVKPINLPSASLLTGVTAFTLSTLYNFDSIVYGNENPEEYDDSKVLDLSVFTQLDGYNIRIVNVPIKYIRLKNDINSPVDIYRYTFENCGELRKVFGHINIIDSPFRDLRNFYINNDMQWAGGSGITTYDAEALAYFEIETPTEDIDLDAHSVYNLSSGRRPLFVDDEHYTNIALIDAESLSGWFSNTKCDINDAYYVLSLVTISVKDISYLFNGCSDIVTENISPLDINLFAKCSGVTNINGIFNRCHINGRIYREVLERLSENNIKEFIDVFSGDYAMFGYAGFFPTNWSLEILAGFNPKNVGQFADDMLLYGLNNLKELRNSFNEATITFAEGEKDASDLFRNCTKLLSISNSFVNIKIDDGTLKNIFGGNSQNLNEYPRQLSSITHSFVIAEGSYTQFDEEGIIVEKAVLPLGNSFLSTMKDSIVYITGNYPGENATYDENWQTDGICASFTGPGLVKIIDLSDCDGEDFPYKIFSGCTKLREFPSLFENLSAITGETKEINLLYNGNDSLFKDCHNLKNISKLFKNINTYKVTLQGDAFKDCSLVNVDELFSGLKIKGQIPLHLFYQETARTEYVSGLTSEQAALLGISAETGTFEHSLSAEEYTVIEKVIPIENPTIVRMRNVLANLTGSSEMSNYKIDEHFLNAVSLNPYYENNFEYLISGDTYTKCHRYVWNEYAYDSSVGFRTNLENELIGIDINWESIPETFIDPEYNDGSNVSTSQLSDYTGYNFNDQQHDFYTFFEPNYFCPPDIFKYCKNDTDTIISGAFYNSGKYNNEQQQLEGLYGRIPELIFRPLSNILSLENIFNSFETIFPTAWRFEVGTNAADVYPSNLLASQTKIEDISGLFGSTVLWKHTTVPSGIFAQNALLRKIGGLWSGVKWIEPLGNDIQVPQGIFSALRRLENISYVFGSPRGACLSTISSSMFTEGSNPLISNFSGLLMDSNNTSGTIPAFWEWSTANSLNGYAAFAGMDSNKISNWQDLVSSGRINWYTK